MPSRADGARALACRMLDRKAEKGQMGAAAARDTHQGIATPGDIDAAVVAALRYPQGPFAWGDALGASTVLSILEGRFACYGDSRYRPSPWLRRRARLGVPLGTVERER